MIPNESLINAWLLSIDSNPVDHNRLATPRMIKSYEVRPPIVKQKSEPCSVNIAQHQFANSYWNPYVGKYHPPECILENGIDQVSQIILTLSGSVSGRQFDRVGGLWIGGSSVLRYTSAEPSGAPTTVWTVDKDITSYASIFFKEQPIVLSLDNVVNDLYTGLFNISVTVDFYFGEGLQVKPDLIVPISKSVESYGWYQLEEKGSHLLSLKLPNNVIKAELEFFISGHGRDEFWYGNDPEMDIPDAGVYKGGPLKELLVHLNEELIGIDWIFPTIYTGGFNPLLWRPVVAMFS